MRFQFYERKQGDHDKKGTASNNMRPSGGLRDQRILNSTLFIQMHTITEQYLHQH